MADKEGGAMTIEALIEKLSAFDPRNSVSARMLNVAICQHFSEKGFGSMPCEDYAPAYTRSLEAVIALVERELPSREWGVYADLENRRYDAFVADDVWDESFENITATAPTPALALCLSLLRALQAMEA